MIIAQISDTHISADAPDAKKRLTDFETVVRDINSLEPAPDLIVHTGDLVQNGLVEEYDLALNILAETEIPVFAIAGNKDDRTEMRNAFSNHGFLNQDTEFIQYLVDQFSINLVMVDTKHLTSNRGDFCEIRERSISSMLERSKSKPTIIFAHHPPCEILVGPDRFQFKEDAAKQRLINAVVGYDNVIAMICGHVHRCTNGAVENLPVSVMSSVATSLRWDSYPEHLDSTPTYQIHRYSENDGLVSECRIASSLSAYPTN